MNRSACYMLGGTAMAVLLWIGMFGSVGHMSDPLAARGAIVGAFIAMQFRRWQGRRLSQTTVAVSSLMGAVAACLMQRMLTGALSPASWFGEVAELLLASGLTTVLMVASFHFLTLRRGVM